MNRFVGTIIDKSYFENYEVIDEYKNIHSFKICKICLEPIDLGFRKDEKSGFACTLSHICKKFEEFLPKAIDLERFEPRLEWGEFVFIEPTKRKEEEKCS